MNWDQRKVAHVLGKLGLATASLGFALLLISEAGAQTTFGGNPQHTADYSPTAQNLNTVHWTTSIDLNNTGGYAHYGAPLITPANTIFVPVKTGAAGGFQINVFNAANGASIYSLSTDYLQPAHNWILPYQPVLATSVLGTRLYYPGAGGTVYYVDNADSAGHGAPVQQVFYTTLATYQANKTGFNSTVFIDTPLTADSSGNVFFGFRVDGTAPSPLSTTQSGFARIDPNGNATYVLALAATGDSNIGRDTHNSAPALSNDEATLYVAVKSASTETYGYLLGLNSSTLATKFKVFLKDPRGNNANNATILDDSTASPLVGPDGDVYFGIFGNPENGSRGFLLHFSGDLSVEKAPGGFGWDNTAAVVPAGMVPSYTGTSSYLLFTKYNNYANAGIDSGDGVNRIALLDPNATQVDAHASSNGMLVMREVLTVIGPTPDQENRSASLPLAVREWCINTAAVNPATNSIFMPSEDGHIYRWNVASNSLTQFLQLNAGIGEPYVPTIIGPDGTVFTLNGGTMSAVGGLSGVGVALTSSTPDVRSVVAGQSLTFTVAVTDTGTSGATPTGTVTLQDTVYFVPSPGVLSSTTTTLGSNIPLVNGAASLTTAPLSGDKHFITATYSGDTSFSAGSSALVQFVHASGSATALTSSPNPSNAGQLVTFTATVAGAPPGPGTPTGMVTFQEGNTVLAQIPLNGSGVASFQTAGLALGSHTVTAVYASDTNFAASSGGTVQSVQNLTATATTVSSSPNPSVSGQSVTFTSTTTSGGGVPVGTVTFTEGATVWASNVNVDGSGHASFSTAALAAGSHTITATFTGATGWGNSSGTAAPQVVNTATAATTTAVSSSSNPSVFSQPVTLTATVTATPPGSGVPAGTVTFKDGAATLGTGTLDGTGHATLTTATLAAGAHSITAVYGGSTSFNTSTSPVLTQTVNADGSNTTVTSSLNPAAHRQAVTFTATVAAKAPGTAIPTGTVTFKDGGKTLGSHSLSAGRASFTTSTLSRGAHQITAVYGGSSNFLTSTSPVLVQTVN
ncbi:MAG TPA: Ig-like domain-containing protein [Bryobacterales bacterium]|nr:Ig-like domain-containing protein [Bryobacterales bacterium]